MAKITIENKSKVIIHGLKPGGELLIEVDQAGTPLDKHWRRRMADSKIDGAILIAKTQTRERVKTVKKKEVKK